ncbi:hypothetical protein B7P43_G13284 [Cryptotermes secundus]|uniref:Uncharacterized protein n=1 Tax=Cryptotermes secundus TaxID=105785 RepID=A0A2J7PE06_9NEOP|nr:hypothetical protein B7P43_G13284 [Cryptotermes secundus]
MQTENRRPLTEMMHNWTVQPWNMVLMKVITKSFSKAGITNALEGREYERLWAQDENKDGDSKRCQTAGPRIIKYIKQLFHHEVITNPKTLSHHNFPYNN